MTARSSRAPTYMLLASLAALLIVGLRAQAGPPASTAAESESSEAPAAGPHVGGHGSTIIIDAHGILVAERDAGVLVRADFDGEALASLPMSSSLGELVHDGHGQVFLADRGANRIVRVNPGDASGAGLAEAASVAVVEPHGLALTPDGATLLVTSVANHELLAFATDSLELRWRVSLAPEPRPVAVSPDGAVAVVGFLTSGALAVVELDSPERQVNWHALDPRDHIDIEISEWGGGKYGHRRELEVLEVEARSRFRVPVETGRQYARNVAALAFSAHGAVVAAHHVAVPQLERMPERALRDVYGGGQREIEPIVHFLSYLTRPGLLDAVVSPREINVQQPRALALDPSDEGMYVGGFGDDHIYKSGRGPSVFVRLPQRCGIDGLAVAADGSLWAHCGLTRRLWKVDTKVDAKVEKDTTRPGPELAPSRNPEQVQHGAELFARGTDGRLSGSNFACANCHPEGRADGLSWRLGPEILQTPVLAGRVGDTAPYKWAGGDPTLHDSFRHTIRRLGGDPRELRRDELDALAAYLDSLPPPMARTKGDAQAAARGRELFEDNSCDACHEGPKLTDLSQHELQTRLPQVDTPSLLGLGHSGPYFHDGSAQDLWALLTDKGSVHDMADTSDLSDEQRRDLIAYLEGL